MMSLIMLMSFSLSFMFLFLKHPLSFGLILLAETLMVSILTGMMNYNFWFSYILLLIMVGGMLILFIYMTNVASNEKFQFSFKFLMFMIMATLLLGLILIFIDSYFATMFMFNNDMAPENIDNKLSISKYMNFPMNKILLSVIIYLLITLIMVVKITNIQKGPLRQKY